MPQRARTRIRSLLAGVVSMFALAGSPASLAAQSPTPADPSSVQTTRFAPGVVRVIPPAPKPEETFDGPMTLQSLLDAHPEIRFGGETHPEGVPHFDPRSRTLSELAKQIILRREIYCFEFAFKPLRQIYVDIPQANGRLKRQLVWYLVYRVRYRGGDLRPAADTVAGVPIYRRLEQIHYPSRRFFPLMVLSSPSRGKEFVDRLLPTAKDKIKTREQITAPLFNSVEITRVKVPYSGDEANDGVWGLATWTDVDPDLDFFSVKVFGLTNAFQQEGEGSEAAFRRKGLELFFYRPGDAIDPLEDRIRFGVPAYRDEDELQYVLDQYGLEKRLDYRWIFE